MQELLNNGATTSVSLGSICDSAGNTLLKLWNTGVPSGKRLFQRHSHINFEITMVTKGSGIYSTKSQSFPMAEGDVFIFASNEYHSITEVGDIGLELTNLHFEPRFLWNNQNSGIVEDDLYLCFTHSKKFQNRIPASKAKTLQNLISNISHELKENNNEYVLAVKSYLNLTMIDLIRSHEYRDSTQQWSQLQSKNLNKILLYIDEHFTEKITLDKLANMAGMSPNYFSSFFKKISGIALWDYINSKRIDTAARMIRNEKIDKNILQIAYDSGFHNTAHFNKTFKKMTGMTPSEYKKNAYFMIH